MYLSMYVYVHERVCTCTWTCMYRTAGRWILTRVISTERGSLLLLRHAAEMANDALQFCHEYLWGVVLYMYIVIVFTACMYCTYTCTGIFVPGHFQVNAHIGDYGWYHNCALMKCRIKLQQLLQYFGPQTQVTWLSRGCQIHTVSNVGSLQITQPLQKVTRYFLENACISTLQCGSL